MNTIQKVAKKVQQISTDYIPTKLRFRFSSGVEALSVRVLDSLNANGRSLSSNRWTGESRIRRIVTDRRFPKLLLRVIAKEFLPTRGTLRISLDHSVFGGITLAVLAVSAGEGRALPIWCTVTRTGRGHPLLKPLIRGLKQLVDLLSYEQRGRAIVIMDRWFASPDLLVWLDDRNIKFLVRVKANCPLGVPWQNPGKTLPAGEISQGDVNVTYHDRNWRFVRSDYRPGMKGEEPWMLLTNIPQNKLTRQQIIRTYAKRFEIEEHFKDIKWIQRFKWHKIKHLAVAQNVFMFAFLGWWLLNKTLRTIAKRSRQRKQHLKKRLSWFRTVWEYWQRIRQKDFLFATE
jgi:hypothetical protein